MQHGLKVFLHTVVAVVYTNCKRSLYDIKVQNIRKITGVQ